MTQTHTKDRADSKANILVNVKKPSTETFGILARGL